MLFELKAAQRISFCEFKQDIYINENELGPANKNEENNHREAKENTFNPSLMHYCKINNRL